MIWAILAYIIKMYKNPKNTNTHKYCSKCGETKLHSEFWKNSYRKDGLQTLCVNCTKKAKKNYLNRRRKDHYKHKYNLSIDDYNELWEKQKGVCAICGKPEIIKHCSGVISHLSVDHNHKTGEVRGLLCRTCNLALGFLYVDDGLSTILNAVDYVRKNDE